MAFSVEMKTKSAQKRSVPRKQRYSTHDDNNNSASNGSGIATESMYKLINVWEATEIDVSVPFEERCQILAAQSALRTDAAFPASQCCTQVEMPLYEEFIVATLWFLFFAIMLWGPLIVGVLLVYKPKIAFFSLGVAMTISMLPVKFNPRVCYHYLATLNLKYFSYRTIWKTTVPADGTYIGVSPPHGLFPFGGILGVFAMPRFAGFCARGAAASVVLKIPVIGAFLTSIGCVPASREVLSKHLTRGESIGISSGGIAEIFESDTNAVINGQECIILKSRGGICKLAMKHGIDIVPGYLFGNSKALNVWYDRWGIMRWLSRKLQVSIVVFWGRLYLPVPYRTQLLTVFGSPIKVKKNENPSREEVQALLTKLEEAVRELFDTHKASFGWDNVELVIK